jgi:predicted transcriptional regulator
VEVDMSAVRDEARKVIDKLPDGISWDDVIYEMYVRKKISEGLKAADEGRMVSHDEAKKRLLRK